MFRSRIRGGKTFAAEQKICDLKELLFKSKKINQNSSTKRLDAKKIIKKKQQIILTVLQHQNMVIHQIKLRKKV